jgi:aminoglycoside phosphotransferase (APT) family kinase protein
LNRADITPDVVRRLVATQFPHWSDMPVEPVALDGWDNSTFRLGDSMSVRLPSADAYALQVEKEQRWLPALRGQLPLPIPEPLAKGAPAPEFPRPWSVYRWIAGETASREVVSDMDQFARDLAAFLTALYACVPAGGPAPGPHSFSRGAHVSVWDGQVRDTLLKLDALIDVPGAGAVWEAAVASQVEASPVWVHGDVTGSNLLVRDGRLAAVIDFGCAAVGDPACDLAVAWTFFDGESRGLFKSLLRVEDSAWVRGRGWALWKALLAMAQDVADPGHEARVRRRWGWLHSAAEVVDAVIEDHRGA